MSFRNDVDEQLEPVSRCEYSRFMKAKLQAVGRALWKGLDNTIQHDGIEHAGYLAFLGLLAFFPFLVLLVALAGVLGEANIGREFVALVFDRLPANVVQALSPRVGEILSGPPQGLLTVAILGAIWTASGAVEGYRTVLNRAYHVGTPPAYLWRRLLSIVELLIFTFVILAAMLVMVVAPLLWEQTQIWLGFSDVVAWAEVSGRWIVLLSGFVIFLAVAMMYKVLPNIRQPLSAVVPGAILTVLLWTLAAQAFSLYLSRFQQVNLIYGSLGGIIAALLFFYILNVIFIYGAEFNYLLIRAFGQHIEQKEAAPAPKEDNRLTG